MATADGTERQDFDELRELVAAALHTLYSTGDNEDSNLARQVLSSAQEHCGLTVDSVFYERVLQRLLSDNNLPAARRWLVDMSEMAGQHFPTRMQWAAYHQLCFQLSNPALVLHSLRDMRQSGVTPDVAVYSSLFDELFQDDFFPTFMRVQKILENMKTDEIPFSRAFLDYLVEGYQRVGSGSLIPSVTKLFEKMRDEVVIIDGQTTQDIHKMLAAASGKRSGAKYLLQGFRKKGFRPNRDTLVAVCDGARSVADLVYWETILQIKADAEIWAIVIQNAAFHGTRHDRYHALEAYRTALRRGIPKSTELFYPVLRAICSSTVDAPTDQVLEQSLKQLKAFFDDLDGQEHQKAFPIYDHMLRALTKSKFSRKWLPIALSLTDEMVAKVAVNEIQMTSVILMLMHATRRSDEAFEVYRKYYKTPDGDYALDVKGYEAVVNTFCRRNIRARDAHDATKSFALDAEAPDHYFAILKDMRDAGYPISPKIYKNLLSRFAALADMVLQDDTETLGRLVTHIRKIHEVITVDGSLIPTTDLWNCLMETYLHVGCFSDAYALWQTMFLRSEFDTQTVNIILDACAQAGADDKAAEIYRKLQNRKFNFNLENWHRWLDHLCRNDKIDEAVKVMCTEMQQTAASKPTKQSLLIVMKYAGPKNLGDEVRHRIQRYLPQFADILQA
ncbi:hypothetical protein EIP91_006167 [Steccherinum ochraceum]|uniref:Pentacotripeptide-repeat region of PRORP domain-containing protein n=1 Tax=Steccherinum ochraceum TaxID=92696 RepID=A0A4R0RC23_9APHY|nr:hypothetical protein EIP91_006167 [Steccherinum ochraceum]